MPHTVALRASRRARVSPGSLARDGARGWGSSAGPQRGPGAAPRSLRCWMRTPRRRATHSQPVDGRRSDLRVGASIRRRAARDVARRRPLRPTWQGLGSFTISRCGRPFPRAGRADRPARPGERVRAAGRVGLGDSPRREPVAGAAGRGWDREDGAAGVPDRVGVGSDRRPRGGGGVGHGAGLRQPASAVRAAARPARERSRRRSGRPWRSCSG